MKVKADADQSAGTQSHAAPGDYIHWFCIGDVNFTTDWTDFDSGWIDVVATGTWGKAQSREDKALYSIAFNLAKGAHNTVYFDDIRVEVERYDPFDEGNLVKNGTANKEWRNGGYPYIVVNLRRRLHPSLTAAIREHAVFLHLITIFRPLLI
jgi:hypothetical protein